MSSKRKHTADDAGRDDDVFRSAPLEDRSSTFIGFFSPSLQPKELQGLHEIKSASHRMLGWRRESSQQSITKTKQYVTKSEDDGEKYGGKRIEKVLDNQRVEGSCVVARWYGGVMLGPVRFEHMETVAKEAIQRWREYEAQSQTKKQRIEEEEAEREQLVSALSERDQSIIVLRSLAFEKEEKVRVAKDGADADGSKDNPQPSASGRTSQQQIGSNYGFMSLDRLRALDKARDATISFLLKRIDKAEAELKALEGNDKVP